MKNYNRFNFDGRDYQLKPLPITEKKKVRRKNMFEKSYVTAELVLTCVAAAVAFSAGLIAVMNWLS